MTDETLYSPELPHASQDVVRRLKVVAHALNLNPQVVYHPAGAWEVGPSQAFPEARIIYTDINQQSMQALTTAGYEAHHASANGPIKDNPIPTYAPDKPVDLLLLLNPGFSSAIPAQSVAEGGYVVCNDYHSNASELHHNPNYELVGLVVPDTTTPEGYRLDTDHPEDYWDKQVETDEELKHAWVGFGSLSYDIARRTVKNWHHLSEDDLNSTSIIDAYKRILEETRLDQAQKHAALIAENPAMAPLLQSLDNDDYYTLDGGRVLLYKRFPNLKGGVDSFFVFRKHAQ